MVIYEIMLAVIADDADRAHEAIVQMAESRSSKVVEIIEEKISLANGDAINGVFVQAVLTPGVTQ